MSAAPTFNDYLDYLPTSVKEFVEETQKKGTEVLGNIQEDVEREVFSKTSEHFDKISEKMENTVKELHGVEQEFEEICKESSALIILLTDDFYVSQGNRITTSPLLIRNSWTTS